MKKSITADVSLLFVAFIWGTTFVVVQNAISILEPFSFNAIRFGMAGLVLFLWLIAFHRIQCKQFNVKLIRSGFILGSWLFTAYALQTIGLLYTTSSKSGFITGLSVVLVPVFAFFALKQTPKKTAIIGVGIATIGLYFLTLGESLSLNLGDILTFFCAISFACHIVVTGKYSNRFPTLLLTVIQILTVSILSWISAFLFEDWQSALQLNTLLNIEVGIALFITALFATAFAFLAQTYFQKYTTPTRVALIFAMEPVFAAITGYVFVGERLGLKALLGCLFIFIGMILAELPKKVFIMGKKTRKQCHY